MKFGSKVKIFFSALFLILFISVKSEQYPLCIYFLDVGQGDCTYAELPNGENLLIDAGNDNDGRFINEFLFRLGVKQIDNLVLTHPHEDHLGGMDEVLEAFSVRKIYEPRIFEGDIPQTLCYNNYIRAAKNEGCPVQELYAGYTLIDDGALSLYCLSPIPRNRAVLNEYSAVLCLEFGQCRFLFMADAEKTNEREMLAAGVVKDCDVIKIGHHGSATSSCKAFLETVNPRRAVISVADYNDYGHPSAEVLRRLHDIGSQIMRTDMLGTICLKSDGRLIRTETLNICADGDRR